MKVLFISYIDFGAAESGSAVRPQQMYRAFVERGHEVKLLSGSIGRGCGKARKEAVDRILQWLDTERPDLCYIESPTYPLLHECDYVLIRRLCAMKIPTAYFYRDFYLRFPALFPRRTDVLGRLKDEYQVFMQWRTDRLLRRVDVVYFPSAACAKMFSYRRMLPLPPAGEDHVLPPHPNNRTCIYVGGISDRYGLPLLLRSFEILNSGGERYRLILVCREPEYERERERIGEHEWLSVYHASGAALEPLYAQADVGLLPFRHDPYMELAVAVKLFQYLGYGLPVVSTDVEATRELVEGEGLGFVAHDDPKSYAAAIRSLLDDDERLAAVRERAVQALRERNLWVHRVDRIVRELTEATP